MKNSNSDSHLLSRRDLLVGAGTVVGAGLMSSIVSAQQGNQDVVFTDTTIVTNDGERQTLKNVSLAVRDSLIAAIGSNEEIRAQFPNAEFYDGSRKALLPGLINCHAHLSASIAKGFNEDFGFPNSLNLPESPPSLLSSDEATFVAVVGAMEGWGGGGRARRWLLRWKACGLAPQPWCKMLAV